MFVVAGESLIDLVVQDAAPGDVPSFAAHPGGSPYNCAQALALLGHETGFLCPISQDGFGDMLAAPLAAAGVRTLVAARSAAPTALAVVTRNERGLPRYTFYRKGTAERDLAVGALIDALPQEVTVMQVGGFAPIEPEDADIWLAVLAEAERRGALVSIDPNVRPALISDFGGYRARLDRFLERAHIVKVSDEDLATLDPDLSIEAHAHALLARGVCRLVVVTRGEAGSEAFTKGARTQAPIHRPERFGDTVGAGDSLMAGVLSALASRGALTPDALEGLGESDLGDVLAFGAVVAGLNCGHVGCHPPHRAEVEAALRQKQR